jgi:bacitracin synthase 3
MKKLPDDNRVYHPLTHAQKRIYYDEKKFPGTSWANMAFLVKFKEDVDLSLLSRAINQVIRGNEALRLRIVEFDFEPEPSQYVHPFKERHFVCYDFSGPSGDLILKEWLEKTTREPFKLIDSDLYYFACIRFDESEAGYYFKIHHLVLDGWSLVLLTEEIHRVYQALKANQWFEDELRPSYIKYIAYEKEYLASPQAAVDRKFWHKKLLPLPETVTLSLKEGDPSNIAARICFLSLPPKLNIVIQEYCKNNKTTLFKLILSALAVYSAKTAGLNDIILGIGNHNRVEEEHKKMIGMFVSTVPLRLTVNEEMVFDRLAAELGEEINYIVKNHQRYPFDLLATEFRELTNVDTSSLLNISLIGHFSHSNEAFTYDYIAPGYLSQPLIIHISPLNTNSGKLELDWEYQLEKFSESDIRRIHNGLINVLSYALSTAGQKISAIDILSEDEKNQILYNFNDTKAEYPANKTIHELFKTQAEKIPDNTVLVFKEQILSYGELNNRAERLGYYLYVEKNLRIEEPVGIMMERSLDLIIAILGVLKAGGAYVPIEPTLPEARIKQMLGDAAIRIVLSRNKYIKSLNRSEKGCEQFHTFIYLDSGNILDATEFRTAPLPVIVSSNTAYIIYTSGSTGTPKGVIVEHRSIVNTLTWRKTYYQMDQNAVNLQVPSFAFDASVEDVFTILISGGRLILFQESNRINFEDISKAVKRYGVTHFLMISSLYQNFLKEAYVNLKNVLSITIGGDICPPSLVTEHFNKLPMVKLFNEYGPTENSVCSTVFEFSRYTRNIFIGKPIYNAYCLILTKNNNLCPVGIPGELCIGGTGLARGYLNRPHLTEEKFRSNPFVDGERMYHSGDLARWIPDGNIEFLGRIDHQVKIRGYRIETGEIEHQLLKQQEIKRAIVTLIKDRLGEKYLCAYIISDEIINVIKVRNSLAEKLPDYMLPSYFMQLERIPLTPGGKIDRVALPNPESLGTGSGYPPPGNKIEVGLAEIWAEVLNTDKKSIGIDDNFFDLGGHSLKVAIMLANIHKNLNIKLTTADIFKMPTVRKLAKHIEGLREVKYASIQPAEKKEYYPQSSAQKRLFVLQQMDKKSTGYNIMHLEIPRENIDKEKLQSIFKALIERHESFRTSFFMKEGEAVQRIHPQVPFELELSETTEGRTPKGERRKKTDDDIWKPGDRRREGTDRRMEFNELQRQVFGAGVKDKPVQQIIREFVRPFDLSKAPLARVGLITVRDIRQILLMDVHHIIADGVSIEELGKEFKALLTGRPLHPLRLQYKDFAAWQNSERERHALKEEEKFWLKEFEGEIPLLNLPADFPRPPVQEFKGDTLHFSIGMEQTNKLKALARLQGATLYMILLTTFNVLLAKLSGQEEIIVGTVTAGRRHADLHHIIGMFANTLALKNYPRQGKTFEEFLVKVKERTIAAFENQDYQFEDLVSKAGARRDTSRNPLFDVSFGFMDRTGQAGELLESEDPEGIKPYSFEANTAKFDLTLLGTETREDLQFTMEFNTKLFKEVTVRRFIRYFRKIAISITQKLDLELSSIDMIPEYEKTLLLEEFNRTEAEYPNDKTIHELFEERVEKSPDNIALAGTGFKHIRSQGMQCISYKELNRKSGQLAGALKQKGARASRIVGVIVERSIEMIIGILGILKIGSAYLPIDSQYPEARMEFIINDSNIDALIMQGHLFVRIKDVIKKLPEERVIYVDDENIYKRQPSRLDLNSSPEEIAYIIFTSGTTGKPKGVMIKHKGICSLHKLYERKFRVTERDRIIQFASSSFDASVSEIFMALLNGASLYMVTNNTIGNYNLFSSYLNKNGITIMTLPPVYANYLDVYTVKYLRILLTAGSPPSVDLVNKWKKIEYINAYGPTEFSICATCWYASEEDNSCSIIPIGKPINNTKLYIVDERMSIKPIGIPGELCISGVGTAAGYLNRPQLTSTAFVRNPFDRGSILYKTGDLARWLNDGNIEFLGRIDTQVKIRGYRIELGEIENQLKENRYIKEAVVIDREDPVGEKFLCAYIVLKPGKKVASLPIAEQLARHLPDYMIPAHFIEIDAVPLSPNGKVDKKALPGPKNGFTGRKYEAPRNKKEQILAETWEQVLGVEKVGINDDFFYLGGDSIKAIQIISRLQKQRLKLELHLLFRQKTVKQAAKYIKSMDMRRKIDIQNPDESIPLTPLQEWFFRHHFENSHHFNQSILLYRRNGFDETVVLKTLTAITSHHDALRMIFRYDEKMKKIIQELSSPDDNHFYMETIVIDKTKNTDTEIKQTADRLQRSMDLSVGPLVKVCLFKGTDGDHLLLIVHHLAIDGVSWRILLEDFENGYGQAEEGGDIRSLQKTDPFHRWTVRLTEYASSTKLLDQLSYWKSVEETAVVTLPVDHVIEAEKRKHKNFDAISIFLEKEKTGQLLTKVNWAFNTENNDILLTALGMGVNQWCGLDRIGISLEGHGREKIMEDVDIHRTVGWFTSQYPVVLDMSGLPAGGDISYAVKKVKETLRRIPDKGIGYGILKYLTPGDKKGSLSFNSEPDISFNYLGQFDYGTHGVIDELTGLSDPRMGDPICPDFETSHKIDISGEVTGCVLKLTFRFNRYEYDGNTIERLARLFETNLERIIDFCLTRKEKELTASDLGYPDLSMEAFRDISAIVEKKVGEGAGIRAIYPLTPMQKVMFSASLRNREAYFIQNVLSLPSGIDIQALMMNIEILNRRYEAGRTIFLKGEQGEPLQVVVAKRDLPVEVIDISHLGYTEKERMMMEFRQEDKHRGFDLTRDQLVRLVLFKTGENTDVLFWSLHHIVMDGWCFPIIMDDLTRLYEAMDKGSTPHLGPFIPFSSYVDWLELQDREEGMEFWEDFLSGYDRPSPLTALGSGSSGGRYQSGEYHFAIDPILSDALTHRAAENQVTLNIMFQTLWGILLQRYTGSEDVLFGAVVSGRPPEIEGIERMVGLFINIVPIRIKTGKSKMLPELLQKAQRQSLMSKLYETFSLAEILERASLRRESIDNLMFFENYPLLEDENPLIAVRLLESHEQIDYPFNFFILPGRPIKIRFSYNGLVFNPELIKRIAMDFKNLVLQVVENPEKEIECLVKPLQ